jgi:phosphatidylethanolamine/phosphatidyl-N-methylethanolamine N-methyltransferase
MPPMNDRTTTERRKNDRRKNESVETIYQRLAPVYDLIYGATLDPGRRQAMTRLAPASGELILEVGVGTGLSAVKYPPKCRVIAIDLSPAMLERARSRFARRRVDHVALCRMDAARLGFGDALFDAVYAPYVMNVVRDPVAVAREMLRVCRPSGRLVLLNHFADAEESWVGDLLGRMAARAGVNWDMDLHGFLRDAGLVVRSVERVRVPGVSSVVTCHKPYLTNHTRRT